MAEESHLEEMNAAIRAQRERQAAPKAMISSEDARPPEAAPAAEPAPPPELDPPKRGLLSRLLGR